MSRREGRGRYGLGSALVLLALAAAAVRVEAAPERFFPVEELRPGMRGTGRTVVQGTKIETFDVEILGVLENAGPGGELVLVRVGGDAIERSGGISGGMSGSPVYVGDRLLGAIGYGFNFADHRLGLVTPIEDMIDALEPGGAAERAADRRVGPVRVGDKVFEPVAVPLLSGSLSPRARERLAAVFERYGVRPVGVGGGQGPKGVDAPFEPGAAIGVQLLRGDIDLTAIGTLTYVADDGRFVAFGHPLLNYGDVDLFATKAYIHETVKSMEAPFKIGSPLEPVGSIEQDRPVGIGGTVGRTPRALPLEVQVVDADRRRHEVYRMEVARDEFLSTVLSVIASLSALDKGIDRLGPGTSTVRFEIEGEGLPHKLVRLNMWYSPVDISALSLVEFLEGMERLMANRFEDPRVSAVRLSVQVERARRTATIESARASRERVRPGERVLLEVTIRPFRGEKETKILALPLPGDLEPGPLTVTIRSGKYTAKLEEELPAVLAPVVPEPGGAPEKEKEEEGAGPEEETETESLAGLVEELAGRQRNNEIVAEFYPQFNGREAPSGSSPAKERGAGKEGPPGQKKEGAPGPAPERERAEGTEKPIQSRLVTPYVIEGFTTVQLTVAPREGEIELPQREQ